MDVLEQRDQYTLANEQRQTLRIGPPRGTVRYTDTQLRSHSSMMNRINNINDNAERRFPEN